jgi:hypothetical protein
MAISPHGNNSIFKGNERVKIKALQGEPASFHSYLSESTEKPLIYTSSDRLKTPKKKRTTIILVTAQVSFF